jgi:hypothetical protein
MVEANLSTFRSPSCSSSWFAYFLHSLQLRLLNEMVAMLDPLLFGVAVAGTTPLALFAVGI